LETQTSDVVILEKNLNQLFGLLGMEMSILVVYETHNLRRS